ncbi:MAG: SPOR domain-containing protein [Pseudomonadota bacterium]
MGFFNILRKRGGGQSRPSANRQAAGDEASPKNGPLTLAVAAAFVIMVALAAVNLRLIRDPSIACKAFGPSVPSRPEAGPGLDCSEASEVKKEACEVKPQVTFYEQLKTVDEQTQEVSQSAGDAPPGPPSEPPRAVSITPPENNKNNNSPLQASSPPPAPEPSDASGSLKLPQTAPGNKRYTVQVGAFTDPGIAKQWALKWKARGYMVSLKPVARPRTGVIYRLYLGSFSSETQADELVKRLKSKEGISALRLVVRN